MEKQQKRLIPDSAVYVLIPAFNEKENIHDVVTELVNHKNNGVNVINKVIVCDNASTDNTAALAQEAGAIVVHEPKQGYGAACLRAMAELPKLGVCRNDVIVFVDGDRSVFTPEINVLIKQLQKKRGLVVGSRHADQIERGAMLSHQRMGNYIASKMIQAIWRIKVTDLGPFRAIHYRDLKWLNMQDERFGWTAEMQVKAIQRGVPYTEVPVSTLKRRGHSKISGTVGGTAGAACGIFSTIFSLWWQARNTDLTDELYR